jgi:exonuclease SbcD
MRVLHTSDWHLNDRLGCQDRRADISRALQQIAEYLDEGNVDVMVVAGDIFSELSTREQLRDSLAEVRSIFLPFLERGGTIVAISGNHDNDVFFETMRNALDLVSPGLNGGNGIPGAQPAGRVYIAPRPRVLPLADKQGQVVQFVLMPYPTARCYLRGVNQKFSNIEERHRAIQAGYTEMIGLLQAHESFDKRLPSVLVSHVHVRGSEIHSLFRISEMDSVVFEPDDIPSGWAYAAYGHIHKPQKIKGADNMRYCGSIERFDAGEHKDNKLVVLFEVGSSGLVKPCEELPLTSTPMHQVIITDPEYDIPRLTNTYQDADRALVKYTLHWDPLKHNREEICKEIELIFPRWYSRKFEIIGADAQAERAWTAEKMQDVTTTVRNYLGTQLKDNARRDQLLALADELLAEEGY